MRQLQQIQATYNRGNNNFICLLLCLIMVLLYSCRSDTETIASKFKYVKEKYTNIQLSPRDTIRFDLGKDAYNKIKSFNCFTENNGKDYISFYDRLSESVMIFDFKTRMPVKQIQLKKIIKKERFYKTSVYVHNYDSIFVTNFDKLYLIDSAGRIHRSTTFKSQESMAYFETPLPVVVKEDNIYMGVRSFVSEKSLSDILDWKVLCEFDLDKDKCRLKYSLPAVYKKGLFGRRFLNYSYCYNDKGNFVFSFPADYYIYETNLTDYHMSYAAKSKWQTAVIEPIGKEALEKNEGGKEYSLRDSYGPIYFDPYTKRYLRVAKQKLTKDELAAKDAKKKTTIIVFNKDFKVIGEFDYKDDYLLDTIFFTADGCIYARVNKNNEASLQFVRLAWENEPNESTHLTKK
jgi:hypothetical protein